MAWISLRKLISYATIVNMMTLSQADDDRDKLKYSNESTRTLPSSYPTSHFHHSHVQSLQAKISQRHPLTMAIIGGSNTAGGGVGHASKLYYNLLASWWNTKMYPATGSKLTNHRIAIGGTGSDFFSFCFQNFLLSKQLPDIVLVELSINDYGYKYGDAAKPMELLTRRLLSLPSKPLVIYVNFVARGLYENEITNTACNNMEDLGFDDLANYYGIPSVSWRDYVCPLRGNGKRELRNPEEGMFNNDGSHVAHKAHSQVATKLIEYLSSLLGQGNLWPLYKYSRFSSNRSFVNRAKIFSRRNTKKNSIINPPIVASPRNRSTTNEPFRPYLSKSVDQKRSAVAFSLPPPKFATAVKNEDIANSACVSFLTPDWKVPLKHTLKFKITHSKDFIFVFPEENKKASVHLKFRTDAYGAWASKSKGSLLKLTFSIPHGPKRSVALIFRTKDNKASIKVWLNDDKGTAITVESNKCGHHMFQTRLQSIATSVNPGRDHTMNVESNGNGYFEVSGVVVGYPGYRDYEGYRPFDVKAKIWNLRDYKRVRC